MSRDISGLLKQGPKQPAPALPDDEFTRQQYLADIARMRDFTPEEDKMMWAKPIQPRWKN
jgi:hypothetical protein